MIEFETCNKSYGKESVLKGLDLKIERGEHVMMTGVSGCGKSTLLRVLAGLEALNTGTLTLDGTVVSKDKKVLMEAQKRSIGYVPQDLGLWGNLSVKQNIIMGRKVEPTRYQELLEQSGLKDLEKRAVAKLSSGERQRVSLVRALVMQPQVLLLDEPFSSLDIAKKQQFYQAVKSLVKDDCTVLTVTHDPADWVGLAPTRIVALEEGAIKESYKRNEKIEKYRSLILKSWQAVGFSL